MCFYDYLYSTAIPTVRSTGCTRSLDVFICVTGIVCVHVLVNEPVIRVSLTDTGEIPCICTSGSVARCAMHEISWNKFKQPGHVYMILGMHCSSLWYMWYGYMHVWYCFYVELYLIILYVFCTLSEMTNKRWAINYSDVMMSTMASQITGVSIVCSTVCSGADQ